VYGEPACDAQVGATASPSVRARGNVRKMHALLDGGASNIELQS
jgi:hypothetical protein